MKTACGRAGGRRREPALRHELRVRRPESSGSGNRLRRDVTKYYDNAGNLTSKTVGVGSTDANDTRTTQTQYDALGRVTAQLSAVGSALIAGGAQASTIWSEYGTSYAYDSDGRQVSQTVIAITLPRVDAD